MQTQNFDIKYVHLTVPVVESAFNKIVLVFFHSLILSDTFACVVFEFSKREEKVDTVHVNVICVCVFQSNERD